VECYTHKPTVGPCSGGSFNIRSFGSWNATCHGAQEALCEACFNIRSFGSWNATTQNRPAIRGSTYVSISALSDRGMLPTGTCCWLAGHNVFQYPLFRIVECYSGIVLSCGRFIPVSISALSDRGMLRMAVEWSKRTYRLFQYPLFRIVECYP